MHGQQRSSALNCGTSDRDGFHNYETVTGSNSSQKGASDRTQFITKMYKFSLQNVVSLKRHRCLVSIFMNSVAAGKPGVINNPSVMLLQGIVINLITIIGNSGWNEYDDAGKVGG